MTDDPIEQWTQTATASMIATAQALDAMEPVLLRIADRFDQLDVTRKIMRDIVVAVAVAVMILGALAWQNYRTGQRLADCTTPSTHSTTHKCSDAQLEVQFRLATATVKCVKDLPAVAHTSDVIACLADSLGIPLTPTLLTPPGPTP